jgi:GT2 family glycosyltransferase
LVHVVIVNFNAGRMLADAVASVIDAADGVVVVDNASSDGSIEQLERQFAGRPSLSVIRRAVNGGFAVGCNDGLRSIGWLGAGAGSGGSASAGGGAGAGARPGAGAPGDAVLFLNPDARCFPGCIEALRKALLVNRKIGAVGGMLTDEAGAEQGGGRRSMPTPWRGFIRAFGLWPLGRWWPQLFPDFHLQRAPLGDEPIAVDAVSGACMMVRRSVVEEVGSFDERYFMHCEDLDLCMRIRGVGYLIKFVPKARVWHALRGTTGGRTIGTEWHKHRGMVRFYRTHWGPSHSAPLMWLVYAGVWVRFSALALWLAIARVAGRG